MSSSLTPVYFKMDNSLCYILLYKIFPCIKIFKTIKKIKNYLLILSSKLNFSFVNINYDSSSLHKSLPSIKGTSSSSFMSIITKSIGNMNLSTLTRSSSTTPYGYLVILSANFYVILGLISKSPIFFSNAKRIRFMLAPKSSKALSTDKAPIVTGRLKLPRSLDFLGKPF